MNLLVLYCLLFICMSLYEYIKHKDFEEFIVAGRRYGTSVVSLSIIASCVGASATIGMAGLAYSVGTPSFWWLGSGAVGLLIQSIFLASKVRQSNVYTLPDMAQKFIAPAARKMIAMIIIPAWVSILAAQYIAASKVVVSLSGVGEPTALIGCTLFIIAYTILGGQNSILKSDVIQYGFVAIGLLVALYFTATVSPLSLTTIDLQMTNNLFPFSKWSYFMIIVGGSYIVCPMLFGRLFSAKDPVHARRSAYLAALGIVLSAVVIVCLGLYAKGLAPDGTRPDAILTQVIPSILPAWAKALLLFALLSTILSSADSCLMTAGSVIENDLFEGQNLNRCRVFMLILGLIAYAVSKSGGSILSLLLAANDIYVCGVVAPMFIAILAHGKRPLQKNLMLAAIFLGGCCGLLAAYTDAKVFSYLGVGVSTGLSLFACIQFKSAATDSQ